MLEKCGKESCLGLDKLEQQLEEYQAQNSASHRKIFERLRELEKSDAVQDTHYKNIEAKLGKLTRTVEELRGKPGRRWDRLAETVIVLLVTAIVAFLLGRLGL